MSPRAICAPKKETKHFHHCLSFSSKIHTMSELREGPIYCRKPVWNVLLVKTSSAHLKGECCSLKTWEEELQGRRFLKIKLQSIWFRQCSVRTAVSKWSVPKTGRWQKITGSIKLHVTVAPQRWVVPAFHSFQQFCFFGKYFPAALQVTMWKRFTLQQLAPPLLLNCSKAFHCWTPKLH